MSLLSTRFRNIGWTREAERTIPPRHAALRDDAVALALRLFRDHLALDREEEARLFGDAVVPEGLVVRDGPNVVAAFQLTLVEGLYLFSDWPRTAADEVLPAGETTAILYRAARARGAQRLLDLGCGSGTLALLLAESADLVTGTDINDRALRLARFNAEVNAIGNVEFRAGSLFDPVAGERFDLIVSQPPYIPLAAEMERRVFLHGGERGDELARAIIGGVSEHLTPGGRALIFSDWPLGNGESLRERIPDVGMRRRVLASPLLTPESYAQTYGMQLARHFSRMGIIGVRQALVILEPGSGYVECEVLPHEWGEVGEIG